MLPSLERYHQRLGSYCGAREKTHRTLLRMARVPSKRQKKGPKNARLEHPRRLNDLKMGERAGSFEYELLYD